MRSPRTLFSRGLVWPFACLAVRLFWVGLAAVIATSATAQPAGTGTIRGRVQNATNGAFMENVVVNIAGTSRQVRTNAYGNFVLEGVPAGEVTLRASYVGEPDQTTSVTVPAGGEAAQNFTFRRSTTHKTTDDGAVILDPFVINAERYRNARAIATAEERLSINIKNVVSVDQFGYIPSGNVGEFVKFMPGVQIDYGSSNGNNQGYSENAANGVSVRGFGPEDTAILIDGLPVSSTLPGNLTRQVGLDQLSINNASRVELIKVATPDMPANSIGGQVNLVTRNAFEYPKPTYSGRLFFNFNSLKPDLKKTPGPTNKDTFKTTPGVDFTVTYPLSDTLGVSFTAYWAQEFNQNYRGRPYWNNDYASNYRNGAVTNSAGEASSMANPVLTRVQVTDQGDFVERRSGNFKVDWRPTPNQLLRANVQYSTYTADEAQRRLDFRPNIANGIEWGPDRVVGGAANSTTAMTVTTRDRDGDTLSAQLQYELDVAGFRFTAAGSISESKSDFRDEENGHFSEIALNLNPGRVALYDLRDGLPGRVETLTRGANSAPVDYRQLSNWVFDGTTAKSGQSHNERTISLYKFDVERPLDFIPFLGSNTLSVQAGFRHDEDENVKSGRGTGYRQILRPGAAYAPGDILDDDYVGQSPGFGLASQQWGSTYKLYEINRERDIFYVPDFDEETNTRVENYNSYVGQQKDLKESVDAWYGMLNGAFFNNRLSFVGGLRQETKRLVGRSPFTDSKWDYVRNADGTLYTDAANPNGLQNSAGNGSVLNGVLITPPTNRPLYADTPAGEALRQSLRSQGISFPDVPYGPPTGNGVRDLRARELQYQPLRAVNQKSKGDPSYSFSTVYRLTKKIDLKAAYSRSFKLPKLEAGAAGGVISGTNNFTIEEYTDAQSQSNQGALGQITVANPGVKPETSNNLDFEVSYHTDSGGKLSVAYWTKDITDQIMNYTTYSNTPTFAAVLNAIGLDPASYEDWRVVTSTNSGATQKPSGWEFEIRQDLGFLGEWGRRFSGFVSYSINELPDPPAPVPYTITTPSGGEVTLTPTVDTIDVRANQFGAAGLQYAGKRLVVQFRGTYRNENQDPNSNPIDLGDGNFLRRIQPAETRIDVNVSYLLTKNFSLFLSGRDVFKGERDVVWRDDHGSEVADFASLFDRKKFGVSWTVGIAATF